MQITISHALSATTPDDPAYEIRPSHWNSAHLATITLSGTDISGCFSNAGNVSFGTDVNGNVTATANAAGAGDGFNRISAGTQIAGTNNTVSFANSNGISFGLSNSSVLTASYTVPSTAGHISAINLSAGTTSGNVSAVTFSNANGVSFGYDGTNVTATVKTDYQSSNANYLTSQSNQAFSASGGSTTFQTLNFANSNGLTFSNSNGSVIASYTVPTQTNQSAIKGLGASNTGNTAGNTGISTGIDWVIAGSNNITISESTAGGGPNTLWISGPTVGGAQTGISGIVVSNTTYTSGTVSFSNLNGISFGSVNATAISASYTVPTVTNSSWTVSDNATSLTISRLAFTQSNGLTLSLSTGVGAATVIGSYTVPTQSVQTLGIYASSQTSGQSSSSTYDARSLTIVGSGNISVGWTNGSLMINQTGGAGANPAASASNGSFTFQTLGFSNANNVTFGTSAGSIITASVAAPGAAAENNWINLLGNNTAGNTTASGSTIGWSGINLTLSGTNNSVVNISAPATSSIVGANGLSVSSNGSTISVQNVPLSWFENIPDGLRSAQSMTLNGASVSHAVQFALGEMISASFIRIPVLMTTNSTTIATTAASGSISGEIYSTWNAVVYSIGVGANSRSLQSVASGSCGWTMRNSLSIAANGTQYSVTQGISGNVEGAGQTLTTQYSISNSNYSLTTNQIATQFSSQRFLDIPFANSLSPGVYWLIFGYSTSSATNSAGNWTNANVRYSNHYGLSQVNSAFQPMGTQSSYSGGYVHGAGSFSTAGGGTTASLALSAISTSASHVRPYFQIIRSN
jgi:hypothetical protein